MARLRLSYPGQSRLGDLSWYSGVGGVSVFVVVEVRLATEGCPTLESGKESSGTHDLAPQDMHQLL